MQYLFLPVFIFVFIGTFDYITAGADPRTDTAVSGESDRTANHGHMSRHHQQTEAQSNTVVTNGSTQIGSRSSNLDQVIVHLDHSKTGKRRFVLDDEGFIEANGNEFRTTPGDFTNCHHRKELLSNYSSASSAFIECAVLNAKPVLYCGHCLLEFEHSKKAWEDIKSDVDCNEDILVSDKLQIVSQTQTFLVQLWHDGDCQECYDEKHNFRPTNSTELFIQKYNETMFCFLSNGGSTDSPVPIGTNVSLCTNCSKEYKTLNELYDNLREDQLCMDIIDLMNRTRILWKDSHCRIVQREYVSVIALSIFVFILPFFFYSSAKIHGTKKEQKLVEKSNRRKDRGLSASARLYAGTTTSLR